MIQADDGRTLWARRAGTPLPNASTTKLAAALVVVENGGLTEEVEVSATAAATPGVRFTIQAGERWSVEELLQILLMTSSNQAAVALAEHVAGGEASFLARMNELAREVGASDTNYATVHGLDAPGHGSSALDLAVLASKVLEDPLLARIVASPSAAITSDRRTVRIENTNLLLESYPGAIGVKTGFTADAGNVLVAAAEREGRRLIAVAMRSEDAFEDSERLLDFGFERLSHGLLLRKRTVVGELIFDPSGASPVRADETVRGIHAPDEVGVAFVPDPNLAAPLEAGDRVGSVRLFTDDGPVATTTATVTRELRTEGGGAIVEALTSMLSFAARVVPGEGP